MTLVVSIALFGWIPLVLTLFMLVPPRRAVIISFLFAWLFLPIAEFKLGEGIPVYSKMTATCFGVLIGVLLFDPRKLRSFHFCWMDVPTTVWCICPLFSSLNNDLGIHDGVSAMMYQTVTWGMPYLIGRLYFTSLTDIGELAFACFVGGLIYVPLCLFEIRMSPQLHTWIYGYYQHSFAQTFRYDGWRPTVFMQHGLMVGMWMCMTTLIGFWLCWTGASKQIWRVPAWILVLTLGITAVLCKSTGAIGLMLLGGMTLLITQTLRVRIVLIAVIAAVPAYIVLRTAGVWSGANLVSLTAESIGTERAQSLEFRMQNEDMLMAKALQQPMFGWGGWGRSRVYDRNGRDLSITDGLWIIALGCYGILGLCSLIVSLLLPVILVTWLIPLRQWTEPSVAPLVVLATVIALYAIDCIPNGMVNPTFMLVSGAVIGNVIGLQGKNLSLMFTEYKAKSQLEIGIA
ncbi:MAG TPA: hypothetical protein VHD56_07930 [Tepidisphaeraceae bacterium]|nr:hypothetical protein [Tepidisphaeraceae bacterium]